LSPESSAGGGEPETTLRLSDIALALQGDWLMMAPQLGITNPEVIKIQKEFGNVSEQVSRVRAVVILVVKNSSNVYHISADLYRKS